jgi:predicted kinase
LLIVSCRAAGDILRRRVAQREVEARDASEADVAVLENQIAAEDPLGPEELARAIPVESGLDESGLRRTTARIAERVAQQGTAGAPC